MADILNRNIICNICMITNRQFSVVIFVFVIMIMMMIEQ